MKPLVVILSLCLPFTAAADDHAKPAIRGGYAFETFRPKQSTCAKVEGALLNKLQTSYDCAAPDVVDDAAGSPVIATCEAKRGNTAYVVLRTAAACKAQRASALASE
jgi:hypothetical protein